MSLDEVQKLRNELRTQLAWFATERNQKLPESWLSVADRLTTLGVDTPMLIGMLVEDPLTPKNKLLVA